MQVLCLALYSLSYFGYPSQRSLPHVWHFFVHLVMYVSKKKCMKRKKAFLQTWFLFAVFSYCENTASSLVQYKWLGLGFNKLNFCFL